MIPGMEFFFFSVVGEILEDKKISFSQEKTSNEF